MLNEVSTNITVLAAGAVMTLFANSASAVTADSLIGQFRSMDCETALEVGANNPNFEACFALNNRLDTIKVKIDRLGGLVQTLGYKSAVEREAGNIDKADALLERELLVRKRLSRVWLLYTGEPAFDE